MTDEDARAWVSATVPRETEQSLSRFASLVIEANAAQNLIARSTEDHIWSRHIADSLQLLRFLPQTGTICDLGSGPGFPGIPLAIATEARFVLVESRRRRIDFLLHCIAALGLGDRVDVFGGQAERLRHVPFAAITARAFAPLDRLFRTTDHLADRGTRWILPKGRGAAAELAAVRGSWQGNFRIERSLTDADASILIADDVRPGSKE